MFLDTSGLLAYHYRTEPQHQHAEVFFEAADRKVTTNYVLAEFVAVADARGLPRVPALRFLADLVSNPTVEVVWVDENLHAEAVELLWDRLDKRWSLCDAVSFTVMLGRGVTNALTTDHHFEQAGFTILPG
jgi:predicted nucleic acid-binding protein